MALLFLAHTVGAVVPSSLSLSGADLDALLGGEVVIRSLSSSNDFALVSDNSFARAFVQRMKKLNPTICAEVIHLVPYEGNEDLIKRIRSLATDLSGYAEIPYYSELHGNTTSLFSDVTVKNVISTSKSSFIDASLRMDPFSKFDVDVFASEEGDSFYFMMTNKEKIKYKFVTAIKKEKMCAGLVVFRDGDNWIMYAVGGAHVGFMFFFRSRIETAFVNRIKDFTSYFIKKI